MRTAKLRFFLSFFYKASLGIKSSLVLDLMTDTIDRKIAETKTKANRFVAQTTFFQRQKCHIYELSGSTEMLYNTINYAVHTQVQKKSIRAFTAQWGFNCALHAAIHSNSTSAWPHRTKN